MDAGRGDPLKSPLEKSPQRQQLEQREMQKQEAGQLRVQPDSDDVPDTKLLKSTAKMDLSGVPPQHSGSQGNTASANQGGDREKSPVHQKSPHVKIPQQQGREERERRKPEAQHHSDKDSDTELLESMAKMDLTEYTPPQHLGTGFVYDELMTQHKCDWDEKYPENPERILQPLARCKQLELVERCVPVPMSYATEDQILWHHSQYHLLLAKSTADMTTEKRMELCRQYDAWYCNKATFECSLAAAGSSIELMDQILKKKVTNGFAMVRPPGHHAMQNEFCGYCTFNNVALAATHALNLGVERILIVDWDVHHGQATQYMFYNDPRVVYFSIHRYEYGAFWPNLRESDYDFIGEGKGKGYNVNVPLNKTGMGDADYMAIFHTLLIPLAYEFSPQVIIISSGYDAAIGCPEGQMLVSPATYAHFVHMLSGVCEGCVCTVLEGGYCLQSLAEGCAMTLRSLLGDPCPMLPSIGEPNDSVVTSILNVVKVLRQNWKCFQVFDYTGRTSSCPFAEVHKIPPRENIEFITPENRPETFEIKGNYPQQSEETVNKFAREINHLIAETSLAKAPNRTCFIFDADMRKHRNLADSTHPERPNRISAIFEKHREWGLLKRCLQLESRYATEEEILAVHGQHYLEDMKLTKAMDEDQLYSHPTEKRYNSIYMCQDTYECARLSAGCVLQVVDAVLSGKAQSGVAVVRPPGHHAESHAAMGFCFFNNVAIAALYARKHYGLKRILIVDWDVHHGNATQHMFYGDPGVLYISLHRYENGFFFPGSREADAQFVGKGEAKGFNVNIPWSKEKMGDAEYLAAFQHIVMPIAYEYAPEVVLVSAGFDAAHGDFLGGYLVMPECYGHMTHMLSGLAKGRVILALEGGYNLNSIAVSMATCTSVLLGDPCPAVNVKEIKENAVITIRHVLKIQKQYWKSLKVAVKVPVPQIPSEEKLTTSEGLEGTPGDQEEEPSQLRNIDASGPAAHPCKRRVFHATGKGDVTNNQTSDVKTDSSDQSLSTEWGQTVTAEPLGLPTDTAMLEVTQAAEQLKLTTDAGDSAGEDVSATLAGKGQGQDQVKVEDGKKQDQKTAQDTAPLAGPSEQGAGSSGQVAGGEELLGACGGSNRPNTVEEVLRMQGLEQLYAIQPVPWCPHLTCVQPLPPEGLDTSAPCEDCGDDTENWVCLVCYKVFCSRYVKEHMLFHSLAEEGHLMVLSYADLSVWCYACNDYIENEITYPMKDAAHRSKFGEALPSDYFKN